MIKTINLFFCFLLVVTASAGCKSTKTTQSNETEVKCFSVGEGGGFTGSYIQYKICSDGTISMYDFKNKEYNTIGTAVPKKLDKIFLQLDALKLDELEISSPGNMSQYITLINENKADHTLTWELNSNAIDPDIISFFHECFTYCNSFEIN